MAERFPLVADALASLDSEMERVALVRLAAKLNNGKEHFDHGPNGYSWLCLACAQGEGMGPFFASVKSMMDPDAPVEIVEVK